MTETATRVSGRDEAVEALNNLVADHPMWVGDDGRPLEFHPLREERISQFIEDARPILRALAARVRAEAVAGHRADLQHRIEVSQQYENDRRVALAERDEYHRNWQEAEKRTGEAVAEAVAEERQRIKTELHELAQLLPVEEAQRTSTWLARAFGTSQVAAGSVPAATPLEPAERHVCSGTPCSTQHHAFYGQLCNVPNCGEDFCIGSQEPSVGTGTPAEAVSGGSGHAERQEDRPVEIASVPIEELPDWADLAEAVGATLHNVTVGCSDEYETEMRWPDGRVASYRDRLAIISADSELPPVEWQSLFERMRANHHAEVARYRAAIEEADHQLDIAVAHAGSGYKKATQDLIGRVAELVRAPLAAALGDGE